MICIPVCPSLPAALCVRFRPSPLQKTTLSSTLVTSTPSESPALFWISRAPLPPSSPPVHGSLLCHFLHPRPRLPVMDRYRARPSYLFSSHARSAGNLPASEPVCTLSKEAHTYTSSPTLFPLPSDCCHQPLNSTSVLRCLRVIWPKPVIPPLKPAPLAVFPALPRTAPFYSLRPRALESSLASCHLNFLPQYFFLASPLPQTLTRMNSLKCESRRGPPPVSARH